jgi:hypothetical protein
MQTLTLVGFLVGLLIVLDFNQRLAGAQRQVDAANVLRTEVAQLGREQAALQTQIAYATTDAAVIAWAHEHGKAVQAGEVLVVPVVPTGPAPTPVPIATVVPVPANWRLWWNLFFDVAPGRLQP